MAQSILKHPRAVMSDLGRDYQLGDEADILTFLERYPAIAPLLFDIRSNIRRFFGDDPVRLEMFYDPEWPEDGPKLVVDIQTCADPMEALSRTTKVLGQVLVIMVGASAQESVTRDDADWSRTFVKPLSCYGACSGSLR
jgi:hypothetical protein